MNTTLLIGVCLLASGTYLLRYYGTVAHKHFTKLSNYQASLNQVGSILLCAVAACAAVYEQDHFSDWARCLGVLAALLLAYWRQPILIVLFGGVATTAVLRLFLS